MLRLILLLLMMGCLQANAQRSYQVIDSIRKAIQSIPAGKEREKAIAFHELATQYMHVSNYLEAASNYARSLTMANKLNDEPLIALIYRNMGVLAANQGDYQKSMDLNLKALAIYEKRKDSTNTGQIMKAIADNKLIEGDSLTAHQYYSKAIATYQRTGYKLGEAMAYSNLALLYKVDYAEKLRISLLAQEILDTANTDNPIPAINAGNIGVAYLDLVRYDLLSSQAPGPLIPATKEQSLQLAEKYILKAIQMTRNKQNVSDEAYFTGVLAELQETRGDFKNAYKNIRFYFEKFDSIYSQDNKNKIAALMNKQEMDLKNAEIESKQTEIANQRTRMLLLVIGMALLLMIGVLLYRQSTMRKKTNHELQRLNAELDEANKVKAKFFAILSHDLRSPIANLVNFLQLQKMKPGLLSEEKIKEHEEKISANAQSLLAAMEGMLLWSKRQMEHFKPVIREVAVKELFDYVETFFSTTQGIRFSFSGADGLVLNTDENYVKTILQNLTSNAVKAVKDAPQPLIEWKAGQQEGRTVLSITDNGPGLPSETFPQQNESTDSRHGLGAYIVRDLAAAIDCEIKTVLVQQGTRIELSFHN